VGHARARVDAMTADVRPLRPSPLPRDPLAEAQARVDAIRRERVATFKADTFTLSVLASEIADRDAGYAPGIAEAARRLFKALTDEGNNLRVLMERK
jgi:hypothetical protein